MVNTRYYDIGKIEEDIAKGYISSKRGKELIDKLYAQTKDHNLEEYRKKFIEEQMERDRRHKEIRENPEKMSKEELQRAIKYFNSNPHEF